MQKIRSLDAMAKLSKKISEMLKKDLIYLGLEKKESKKLQDTLFFLFFFFFFMFNIHVQTCGL